MSISKAIQEKDFNLLKETVDNAVKIYNAAMPDEAAAMVNTVHGDIPASMLFDDESKWMVITSEYVTIANKVKALPKGVDEKIETAKIIANSAILRHITAGSTATKDSLL